jgi:hypothetical protein
MSKKEFQKVSGQLYALGIQHGKTEDEMLKLMIELKHSLLSQWKKA